MRISQNSEQNARISRGLAEAMETWTLWRGSEFDKAQLIWDGRRGVKGQKYLHKWYAPNLPSQRHSHHSCDHCWCLSSKASFTSSHLIRPILSITSLSGLFVSIGEENEGMTGDAILEYLRLTYTSYPGRLPRKGLLLGGRGIEHSPVRITDWLMEER